MSVITFERERVTTDGTHGQPLATMISFDGLAYDGGLSPTADPVPTFARSEDLLELSTNKNETESIEVSLDETKVDSLAGKFIVRK